MYCAITPYHRVDIDSIKENTLQVSFPFAPEPHFVKINSSIFIFDENILNSNATLNRTPPVIITFIRNNIRK